MKYSDGSDIKPGDLLSIDGGRGRVIASMDTGEYLPGEEGWADLGSGIMVDTDFGGLVHYTSIEHEEAILLQRAPAA